MTMVPVQHMRGDDKKAKIKIQSRIWGALANQAGKSMRTREDLADFGGRIRVSYPAKQRRCVADCSGQGSVAHGLEGRRKLRENWNLLRCDLPRCATHPPRETSNNIRFAREFET